MIKRVFIGTCFVETGRKRPGISYRYQEIIVKSIDIIFGDMNIAARCGETGKKGSDGGTSGPTSGARLYGFELFCFYRLFPIHRLIILHHQMLSLDHHLVMLRHHLVIPCLLKIHPVTFGDALYRTRHWSLGRAWESLSLVISRA